MTRQEELSNWLGDRQRKYADGISIFKGVARKVQLDKYAAYFDDAPANPGIFDPHFTMLVNVLTKIEREMTQNISLYPSGLEQVVDVKTLTSDDVTEEIAHRNQAIGQLTAELEHLKNELMYLIEENAGEVDDRSAEIGTLIERHEEELAQLRSEVDELMKPGVKVVTETSMPPSLKKAYARIKEIAPLYASLHNDLADELLPDDKRKVLAEQLCKLDDERRRLWKAIDDWSEGKEAPVPDDLRPQYSENPVVRGIELARAVKRLKQNIGNSRRSAEKALADGRQVVHDNALQRIAQYEKELAEIEAEINGGTA